MRRFSLLSVVIAACLLGTAHGFSAAAGLRAVTMKPMRRAVHFNMAEEEPASAEPAKNMDAFVQPPETGPGSPGWIDPK